MINDVSVMETRQKELLNLVVDSYINTAEPVGSKFLAYKEKVGWSEATIRNDLRALEDEGFLSHPHTSAGRIPTERGYRFFVDSLDFDKTKINKKESDSLFQALKLNRDFELSRKNLAKELAEISGLTVLLAFSPNKIYYTGLANLFSQPEFGELKLIADVSAVFDRCEECLDNFYDEVEKNPRIFIGKEHPFGNLLSVVAFRFRNEGLFTLLGPTRMNYRHNLGLMNVVKEII